MRNPFPHTQVADARAAADGVLAETTAASSAPSPPSSSPDFAELVADLDLLLTGARLNEHSRRVLRQAFDFALAAGEDPVAAVLKIIVSSAEWHTTNDNALHEGVVRADLPPTPSGGRKYKAIVASVVF